MIPDSFFPGVEDLPPEAIDAITKVAEQTGLLIRRRCCMPEFARATACGWRHRPITASIRGGLDGLSESQVKDGFRQALDGWNSVCNTGLQWTDDFSRANIWAECKPIDGSSGTLAWSYLIGCGSNSTVNTRIEQRYDTSERWTASWFLEVCLHELGHAIGLDHIQNKDALMNPYSAGGRILMPTKWEIERVLPLYGPPVASPAPGIPTVAGGVIVFGDLTAAPIEGGKVQYAGRTYNVEVKP